MGFLNDWLGTRLTIVDRGMVIDQTRNGGFRFRTIDELQELKKAQIEETVDYDDKKEKTSSELIENA